MSSNAHDATDTASTQEAFPRLPNHLVVALILRSEHFDDPADLARLPAVSRAMRDAVAATGLRFKELGEKKAVMRGCVSVLKRLQRGGRLSRRERLCQAAARVGHLEELTVLRADGWPWDRDTCSAAALGGHLEVLQWLRTHNCPWDEVTCRAAARGGHLEVLQWARANGRRWDVNTYSSAAAGGHLEVLQWAHANDAPWNEITCGKAAQGGHLEVLQWARANDCPWYIRTCEAAA
jgi:ankyrin repeat protein